MRWIGHEREASCKRMLVCILILLGGGWCRPDGNEPAARNFGAVGGTRRRVLRLLVTVDLLHTRPF